MGDEFTPPYMRQGLYDIETRRLIEAANRETMAGIFKRRVEEKKQQEWMMKLKSGHDSGVHIFGPCPYCPANYFYD